MGRPLTGSLRHYQGLWWAAIPKARGSKERRQESFLAEDDARAWLTQAVTALANGLPVPDPERFRTHRRPVRPKPGPPMTPEPAKLQPDIASVSNAWMAAAYEDLRRGGPDREERVRRIIDGYLVPWFAPRTATVADITYFMCHDWLLHLVGREPAPKPVLGQTAANELAVPAGPSEYSLMAAAEVCGVSETTVRRRWRDGLLPGAYRLPGGHIRVPAAALVAVPTKPRPPTGLSHKYVVDALWVLRKIIGFARANGMFPPGFDPTESLAAPSPDPAFARTKKPTSQLRPLSLPECARIAAHLHVVHQMVFWLQRIMGLRISEAYGIFVYDVIDLDDVGLIAIQGQGGRSFTIRDDHGHLVAVPHKETTKTAAGSRVLVAPSVLMHMIRVCIEAFHTDPDTGEIERNARLVPGIMRANEAGQAGYQEALIDATIAEGLATADLGFRVSSHLLRKSLATDLAWETGIEDTVRRRFMGHRAGDDVFGRIYTLDHPDVAPLAQIATVLDRNISSSIGGLLTPTTRTLYWGRSNPMYGRAEHVNTTLGAAGWMIDPGGSDDPLCDTNRVAAELDVNYTTAKRWMLNGTIPAVMAADEKGITRRYARLSDVDVWRNRMARSVQLPDLLIRH